MPSPAAVVATFNKRVASVLALYEELLLAVDQKKKQKSLETLLAEQCVLLFGWRIAAMLDRGRQAVNVLKKVKVNGKWKFCPAIIDAGRKLRDKVRVNGHTEVHPEGVYYIEWRRHGRRVRESVSS